MVLASTLVLFAAAAVPALAAPLSHAQGDVQLAYSRSVEVDTLDARAPFNFKKLVRKIAPVAKTVGGTAARLLFRDEEGNIYERDLSDLDEFTARDFAELDARAPFNFKKLVRKIAPVVKRVGGTAARLLFRDEEGNVYERDLDDLDEFTARDFAELDARAPFNFKKLIRKIAPVAKTVGGTAARLLFRDEEGNVFERDLSDLDELTARDLAELDARAPKIKPSAAIKTVTRVAGKATRTLGQLGRIAGGWGLRELEDAEFDARDAVDDVLDAREPQGSLLQDPMRRLAVIAKPSSRTPRQRGRMPRRLRGPRELEGEEIEARGLDELD